MIAAGVTKDTGKLGDDGRPLVTAKYSGMHALRHFYASWCTNPVAAGGQALTAKAVQERLGHSTIAMTLDTYGHIFPVDDKQEIMAAAEQALLI